MIYGLSEDFLKDGLPIHVTLNGEVIRRHLHKTASRQDGVLDEMPEFVSGCAYEWWKLSKPDKPLTVDIDGGDTFRELQYIMYPEAEHTLDWFHVTMRLTVLNQLAKGLVLSDPKEGARGVFMAR